MLVSLAASLLSVQHGFSFYNPSAGRWLSRDLVSEDTSKALSAFANNDPIGKFDLGGLLTVSTLSVDSRECQELAVKYRSQLDHPALRKGYIVIKNTNYRKLNYRCEDPDCPVTGQDNKDVFWEAMFVEAGSDLDYLESIFHWSDQALFQLGGSLQPSCGYSSVSGEVRFYYKDTTGNLGNDLADPGPLAPGWHDRASPDPQHPAPTFVPYTWSEPRWWRNTPVEGTGTRGSHISWACGCYCKYWEYEYWPLMKQNR
jgi:hypothetical protein